MDEVHLSIAASALQRIHDSAPNSQHSEALQSSVWQVAGGAIYVPPLFNLPPWVLDRENDEEYFSHLPPATLTALVAISLRARRKIDVRRITTARVVHQRMDNSKDPQAHLIIAVFDLLDSRYRIPFHMRRTETFDLTSMIRGKELPRETCLWLLSILSELRCKEWLSRKKPFFIGICLPILMDHASKWPQGTPPDIVLLEAVVTLSAISCSPDRATRLNILSNSRDHPWLLLNIRNTNLISTLYEGTHSNDHKQLTSLLFLIVCALMYRESYDLAVQYFTIITAKGDLPLNASALTAIAPAITDIGLSAIGRMLVAPHTRGLTPISPRYQSFHEATALEEMFNNYDGQLRTDENPDPNIFAILLMLSKHASSYVRRRMQNQEIDLKNSWLSLAARVVARLDIPGGSGFPKELFYDQRVHNMIAALSLLPCTQGDITQYTQPILLASFLRSQEMYISSVALEYYMRTTMSYYDPPAPSCYLSAAVSSAFNLMLPEEELWKRWTILDIFVNGFDALPVEWRRTFAESFFTLLRRSLPRLRGDTELVTRESELEAILTWEYFHEEEQEPELTDSPFSGLDWMAMAWSLHLSQRSERRTAGSRQGTAQFQDLIGSEIDEEFVFRALCKLLEAAPYYRIIPIIPTLREFMQWFDDTEFPEYRSMSSAQINEAFRRHEESQMLHRFRKFDCVWYI